jgi:hypothetical protein
MSEHSHFQSEVEKDLQFLVGAGLVEVAGINEDGEWLYQPTAKGKAMSLELMKQLIETLGEDE